MPFSEIIHETKVRVRFAETDAAGIVHHGSYIPWLELGRVEWLRAIGHSYADLEKDGYHLAVVEMNCRYVRPARFDDQLVVRTAVTNVRSREVSFIYEVVTDAVRPHQVCNATTRHFWLKRGRIAKMPAALSLTLSGAPQGGS